MDMDKAYRIIGKHIYIAHRKYTTDRRATMNKEKAIALYYKLHRCLKISIVAPQQANGDNLSCHTNYIVRMLAKSIESNEEWYDASVDCWCDYFLGWYERFGVKE